MSPRVWLDIKPRDPFVARDGRPFATGNRMRSVDWAYPSVLAGSLRTMLGKALGHFDPEALRAIEVGGGFPVRDGELFFPPPLDCVLRSEPPAALAVKPDPSAAAFTSLPSGLAPCLLPATAQDEFKPARQPAFVSARLMASWLRGESWSYPFSTTAGVIDRVPVEERTHVALDPSTLASREGMLYQTAGLALPPDVTLQARCSAAGRVDGVHPLGGERRLAFWQPAPSAASGWACDPQLQAALSEARRIRMVLATPALFDDGWKPAWLRGAGLVPGTSLRLHLEGACVGRGRPVSGWSLEKNHCGPKPTRRMAPAGSVYFFEILDQGDPRQLPSRWLESVSDQPQDRTDGFGLALWGVWND